MIWMSFLEAWKDKEERKKIVIRGTQPLWRFSFILERAQGQKSNTLSGWVNLFTLLKNLRSNLLGGQS